MNVRPLFLSIALLCTAAAPQAPELNPDEVNKYNKGKVVIRHEDTPQGGRATAFVKVNATPRQVIDAIMDLEQRPNESGVLTGLDRYRHDASPEVIGATFTVTVLGSNTVFSILYECQRDEGYCTYKLDPSKPQDIVYADGFYVAVPEGSGARMIYSTRTNTGKSMPGWMKRWLAGSSLEGQVDGIRKRAESQ